VAVTVVDGAHPSWRAGALDHDRRDLHFAEPGVGSRALWPPTTPQHAYPGLGGSLSAPGYFLLDFGHDALTYNDPNFWKVLGGASSGRPAACMLVIDSGNEEGVAN
jgi:hypothetical protein